MHVCYVCMYIMRVYSYSICIYVTCLCVIRVCTSRVYFYYVCMYIMYVRALCVYVHHGCKPMMSESIWRVERWGAGVETQKNVRGEIGGWGRVPFNEPYAPSLSTIFDGA